MNRCTMVIPCYNEAARLDPRAFREFLTDSPLVRFHFVDDGSTDSTSELIRELRDEHTSRVALLELSYNVGKAEAVRTGMLAALREQPDYFGYWDADLATPLSTITTFIQILETRPETELVLGSRVPLLGHEIHRGAIRHMVSRLFAKAASWLLGVPVFDTQCGAKLLRNTPRTRQILQEPFLSKWLFDVELLARHLQLIREQGQAATGTILLEHPLESWQERSGTHVRLLDFGKAGYDFVRIAWSLRRHRNSARWDESVRGEPSAHADESTPPSPPGA